MKTQHSISKWSMALGLAAMSSVTFAGVADSKHNLGSQGTAAPSVYTGTTEVCVFCHTPHGATTDMVAPLWNRNAGTPSYTTYDELGITSYDAAGMLATDTTSLDPGDISLACLSCHDGTQAMDSIINQPGSGQVTAYDGKSWTTGGTALKLATYANLSQDLRDDHPIGIPYAGGGITGDSSSPWDADFVGLVKGEVGAAGSTMPVWWIDTLTGTNATGSRNTADIQLYTRTIDGNAIPYVECASCHDVHTSDNLTFLRIPNTGSAVCLACHTK